jgi:hypothetical protein
VSPGRDPQTALIDFDSLVSADVPRVRKVLDEAPYELQPRGPVGDDQRLVGFNATPPDREMVTQVGAPGTASR